MQNYNDGLKISDTMSYTHNNNNNNNNHHHSLDLCSEPQNDYRIDNIQGSMLDNNGKNLKDTEASEQAMDRRLTWLEGFFRGVQVFLAELFANLFFFSVTLITAANGSSVMTQAIAESVTLMVVLAIFMRENAGHLDVFLTPVLWFLGKLGLPFWYIPVYWLAQVLAMILATLFTWSLVPGFDKSLGLGTTYLTPGYTQGQGCGAEVLGTFIETSAFIWLLMAFGVRNYYEQIGASYKSVVLFILSIGFSHLGVAITFGPITGAALNWLRHFMPAIISGTINGNWWIYFVGSLFGTLLSLVVFKIYIWIDDNAGEHAYKRDLCNKVKTC